MIVSKRVIVAVDRGTIGSLEVLTWVGIDSPEAGGIEGGRVEARLSECRVKTKMTAPWAGCKAPGEHSTPRSKVLGSNCVTHKPALSP